MTSDHWPDMFPEGYVAELARYNAECARGIVHTKEWDQEMARRQERFNEDQRQQLIWKAERSGATLEELPDGRGWLLTPPPKRRRWWHL